MSLVSELAALAALLFGGAAVLWFVMFTTIRIDDASKQELDSHLHFGQPTHVVDNADYRDKAKVVFDEALRMIQNQQARLGDTRARAGVLLSAGSISAAFLGAQALDNHRAFEAATWVATIAFCAIALVSLALLWPRKGWKFSNDPAKLLSDYVNNASVDLPKTHSLLAKYTGENYEFNERRIAWRFRLLSAACLALGVEIVAFLIDLSNRGVPGGK